MAVLQLAVQWHCHCSTVDPHRRVFDGAKGEAEVLQMGVGFWRVTACSTFTGPIPPFR